MAWVFEKSPTWRKIVGITKRSPLAFAGFTAVCFGGPYAMAKLTMNATNPEIQKEEAQKRFNNASLHQKVHLPLQPPPAQLYPKLGMQSSLKGCSGSHENLSESIAIGTLQEHKISVGNLSTIQTWKSHCICEFAIIVPGVVLK